MCVFILARPGSEAGSAVTEETMNGDIERASPPQQMADALCGATGITPAMNIDTLPPLINPWAPKVEGDGRLTYTSDELEEAELQSSLVPIRKLFTPRAHDEMILELACVMAAPAIEKVVLDHVAKKAALYIEEIKLIESAAIPA
jgi:hypothetical protein